MENIVVRRKSYEIKRMVIEKEDHTSFECEIKGKRYFVKQYTDLDSFGFEIKSYKEFSSYGIRNPKLLRKDKNNLTVVYEFINGIKATDVIADGTISDDWFEKLFLIYRFARFSKIDINYLPEFYQMYNGELVYLNHYFFEQNPKKNLENYGIDFWLYGERCAEHLKELGYQVDKSKILTKPELNKKIVLLSIMKW